MTISLVLLKLKTISLLSAQERSCWKKNCILEGLVRSSRSSVSIVSSTYADRRKVEAQCVSADGRQEGHPTRKTTLIVRTIKVPTIKVVFENGGLHHLEFRKFAI